GRGGRGLRGAYSRSDTGGPCFGGDFPHLAGSRGTDEHRDLSAGELGVTADEGGRREVRDDGTCVARRVSHARPEHSRPARPRTARAGSRRARGPRPTVPWLPAPGP